MSIHTKENTEETELDQLRREIHETAEQFGETEDTNYEEFEVSNTQVPISSEWSPFDGGPIQAKWVPTDKHDCTLILFDVPAGTIIDFHNHRPTESFVVVGDVTVYRAGETERLKEGDVIKIEESEPHAAEFHEDTLVNMLWTPSFPTDPEAPGLRVLYEAGGLEVSRS